MWQLLVVIALIALVAWTIVQAFNSTAAPKTVWTIAALLELIVLLWFIHTNTVWLGPH